MAQTRTRLADDAPADERRNARRRLNYYLAAAVVAVLLAGYVGWLLNDQFRSDKAVSVTSTFTGKVTIVNGDGTAGCVKPDGGAKVCSAFAVAPGVPKLQVGQTVKAAHQKVDQGNGNSYDLLLIYPENPPA